MCASGNLAAYGHQDVPFERLVEALNPSRSLSRHPLFQVMLAFQNNAAVDLELEGVAASFEAVATSTSKFDLALSACGDAGTRRARRRVWSGTLEYATDLFDGSSAAGLVDRLVRLLEAAVARSGRCAWAVSSSVGRSERRVLLEDWNATARAVPASSVVDLFAAQARATPDAVAVVHGDRELSYAALDAQSNRLAHHLRGLGVGAETVVGLYVERSLETVIGLLGILKAGAAYLPLDPSYPAERLAFMLSDARCAVLVTQSALAQRLPAAAGAGLEPPCRNHAAPAGAARRRLAGDRAAAGRRARRRHRARPGRLRHLHIGLNRNPKGRGGRASKPCEQDGRTCRSNLLSGATSERRFSFLPHSMPRSSRSCCRWLVAVQSS